MFRLTIIFKINIFINLFIIVMVYLGNKKNITFLLHSKSHAGNF